MSFLKRSILIAVVITSGLSASASLVGADEPILPRRVLLVVWDGLRPDSVSDETTPTLAKLAREGVFFTRHHSAYPTSTEVNGTAMMTGCYPGHSGLIANREYRPAIDPHKIIAMEDMTAVRKGDDQTGGHYLLVPTLPELLHAVGMRTLVVGTKRVAVLLDRAVRSDDETLYQGTGAGSVVLSEGETLPDGFVKILTEQIGRPFPKEIHFPNVEQDTWTAEALTGTLWKRWHDGPPPFTVLWMSDPDYTQHQFGPDTPPARRALASVDARLASVLAELYAQNLRATTDVLVVSDHGFSTIGRGVDFAKELTDAGFRATREYKAPPARGDVLINGLGGTVFLHVAEHDPETIRRLVGFLQGTDFAGVIFTRDALPGTFTLKDAHIDSPDAPDIAVAMRWNDDRNATGFLGAVVSDGSRKPGQGTHSSLSRYDLHNTLIAAGPDFRQGWRDELPSGNVDVAPTIAHLLGLKDLPKMDGRVLTESLRAAEGQPTPAAPHADRHEAVREEGKVVQWSQYLQITRFGGVDYFDEGNGAAAPR